MSDHPEKRPARTPLEQTLAELGVDVRPSTRTRSARHQKTPYVAVTPAGYDDIAQVLKHIEVGFETVNLGDLRSDLLARFSAVFLNCSPGIRGAASESALLASWVAEGGWLYASDWAGDYLQKAFGHAFSVAGNGHAGTVNASIQHSDLRHVLGVNEVLLEFDMPGWCQVTRYEPQGAEIFLVNGEMPLMLSIKHGQGRVVFTSFHNSAQSGETIAKLLRFLILVPVVRSAQLAHRVMQLSEGNIRRYLELGPGKNL